MVKKAERCASNEINITRTVRRTYALAEVVSVHAATSACEGFGRKNTNEIPSLQSRSGFLNYCGSVAPLVLKSFTADVPKKNMNWNAISMMTTSEMLQSRAHQ